MAHPADLIGPPHQLAEPMPFHPHLTQGRSVSAVFGVLWSTLQTLIPTISTAAVFFVSAFYLSPSDFGLVGLASSIVMIVIAFSPAAFGEALVQRKALTQTHADSVFWMTTVFGLIGYLPFAFCSMIIAAVAGNPELAALLSVLSLRIPLDMMAAVPNAMIIRSMKFKLIALRTAVATIVSMTVCIILLIAGFGYWALVVSQVLTSFIACVIAFWVCGWRPGVSIRWAAIKELASYGVFASGNRMLNTLKLDHLVLGVLGGTALLGLFILAQRLYGMLTQLVGGALSSVTLALLSTLQGDHQKTADAFGFVSFLSASVSMPMFCLLAIIAPDLLKLLPDPQWADAAFAVQAFCAMGLLACIGVVQSALINSQGKANWWFYYQLVQQGSSVLVIALTYQFGLQMMMIVLAVKSMLIWPASVVLTVKLLHSSVQSYLVEFCAPVTATLLMALAILALPMAIPTSHSPTILAVQIATSVIVYVPMILALSYRRIIVVRDILFAKKVPTT